MRLGDIGLDSIALEEGRPILDPPPPPPPPLPEVAARDGGRYDDAMVDAVREPDARDILAARGDGIPGREGKARLTFGGILWTLSRGETGSLCGGAFAPGFPVGVSSGSLTRIHPLGLRKVELVLSPSVGVDIGAMLIRPAARDRGAVPVLLAFASALWLALELLAGIVALLAVDADDTVRFDCPNVGPDTIRRGAFAASLSSVALSRACKSCSNLKPLVLAARLGLTRAAALLGAPDDDDEATGRTR